MDTYIELTKDFQTNAGDVINQGTRFQKFSETLDLFSNQTNFIVLYNKKPILIPYTYATRFSKQGNDNSGNPEI